eukprot:3820362-Heterocapsa_arctica.AAC.1
MPTRIGSEPITTGWEGPMRHAGPKGNQLHLPSRLSGCHNKTHISGEGRVKNATPYQAMAQ